MLNVITGNKIVKEQDMKVILLGATPPPNGGIASWTNRMLNSAFLSDKVSFSLVDEKLKSGRDAFGHNSAFRFGTELKRCIGIWGDLDRRLEETGAKVVHANIPAFFRSMMRETICALISHKHGAKFIIHFRCTTPIAAQGLPSRILLRILLSLSDGCIVLNQQSKDDVGSLAYQGRLRLIPNFIENASIGTERSCSDEVSKIVYVGGITRDKGCDTLISVAKHLRGVEFRLVGAVEEAIVSEAPDNVVFLGPSDKDVVKKELRSADLFLFLTRYKGEGFSNALAEAMAEGLPCVASDWAANADMLEDKGGRIVPICDVGKTVEAIKDLSDKALRDKCSQFNVSKVRECYSETIVLNQYYQLYRELS